MSAAVRSHAAVDDGERIRPGRIGQPANTASSLAFVLAAAAMVRRALQRDRPAPWLAVAASTALVGLGSVGFHGPGNRPGKTVHDVGVASVAITLPVALAVDPPARPPRLAVALGVAAGVLHTQSRTGGRLAGTDAPLPGHSFFHLLAAAALAATVPSPPDVAGEHRGRRFRSRR